MVPDATSYNDGTVLLHLHYNDNPSAIFNSSKISLRLIFPNGTVRALDVEMGNYYDSTEYPSVFVYALTNNNIFITYLTYTRKLAIISNWDGKITFGPYDLVGFNNYRELFVPNVNPSKGFLWAQCSPTNITWFQFTAPDQNGQISLMKTGVIVSPVGTNFSQAKAFPTVDGNYGMTLTAQTNRVKIYNVDNSTVPLSPNWFAYATFLDPEESKENQMFLIYQTSVNLTDLEICDCSAHYDSSGYTCILLAEFNKETPESAFMKVSFYSTGSILDIDQFNIEADHSLPVNQSWIYKIRPLYYGGYMTLDLNMTASTLTGLIYDRDSKFVSNWQIPDAMPLQGFIGQGLLPNNTLWLSYMQMVNNNSWSLITTDMPKMFEDNLGFNNPNVIKVSPYNQNVSVGWSGQISLTYRYPIVLSSANISIYQYRENGNDLLRQTINPQTKSSFCEVSNDPNTITCMILPTTCSLPDAKYYVVVDNNFAKTAGVNEPLFGIKPYLWNFTTESVEVDAQYVGSALSLMRLSLEGSTLFKNLTYSEKKKFFDGIQNSLAEILPVDPSRIIPTYKSQADPTNTDLQLLQFKVMPVNNLRQPNVKSIISSVDVLIRNKYMTGLSSDNYMKYSDEAYGFQATPNLWDEIMYRLIGGLAAFVVLAVVYVIARRKNKDAKNLMILKFALSVTDLTFDTLFVVKNSRDVPCLFVPSLFFYVFPFCINFFWGYAILFRQTRQYEEFSKWLKDNTKIATFFTILGGSSVELLGILSSHIFGLGCFNAPFQGEAENLILSGAILNLIIEDIPQLLIQILYESKTVSYSIIPLSTLIVTSIVLVFNILARTYDTIVICRGHNRYQKTAIGPNYNKELENDKTSETKISHTVGYL
ncbi:9308_t:CDS:10 [Ambispora leptoticha]|uniref:9308_t:CDS:1 n=1 Tax=Ambispora leptoticha TaxID=144679 RepID=A0A9N9FAF9_9GLOM|nr:9308_t:CDS:10 [Ambispora leptoticha]